MTKRFIDISEHNTILSFNGMFNSNLVGVIHKATEGTTFIDHALEFNYDGIKGKIPLGFYHYLTSTSDPETQAQNFYNQIKNKDYQIIPVLDVEQPSLGNKAQQYAERFIQEFFVLSGQNMIIYSGRCYIEDHFDVSFRKDNNWWVADYSANEVPTVNGCRVIAWQYTESSNNYAFNLGDLDVNILVNEELFYLNQEILYSEPLVEYDGSVEELQEELNNQGFTDYNGDRLEVDGISGELTLSACPTLSLGAKGNITSWAQSKIGCYNDGIFGENTRQAVIEFQENMVLDGDGIIGKNTWRKLLGM